jgi:hypothetical protein
MEPAGKDVTKALAKLGRVSDVEAAYAVVWHLQHAAPRQLAPLLAGLMQKAPQGGTYFDAALSLVSVDELAELVTLAVEQLEADAANEAACACIAYASLQAGSALRPHLSRLFVLRPNASSYYAHWPWRYASDLDVARLQRVVQDERQDAGSRLFAWDCLLETRREEVVRWALRHPVARPFVPGWSVPQSPESGLAQLGLVLEADSLRSLWSEPSFHLRFSDAYLADFGDPPWRLKSREPSWTLPAHDAAVAPFGGVCATTCTSCGAALHCMVALDPVPPGLGVSSVQRLRIQTCLSCLGWEHDQRDGLQVRHDVDGSAVMLGEHAPHTPQFVAGPLRSTEVRLCPSPERWRRQDWALSNGRDNLNRLGGEPSWIQGAQYPACMACGRTMAFLLQLDSGLHAGEPGEWLWGSGGIGYFFWCDPCRVSGALWQCT